MGKKSYQHPDKAVAMELSFTSGVSDDAVSWVELKADKGPYGTSDYYVGLYTIAAEEGAYIQITSSQKVGSAAKAAMNIYFKTAARSKIGFSVVGTDKKGEPVYSSGELAALERNVARYLLALREYMLTRHLHGVDGFRVRYAPWFDATEQYHLQLREVDRDDYLRDKEKEYLNQLQLQTEVNEQ
jgi:hypothetical protein